MESLCIVLFDTVNYQSVAEVGDERKAIIQDENVGLFGNM